MEFAHSDKQTSFSTLLASVIDNKFQAANRRDAEALSCAGNPKKVIKGALHRLSRFVVSTDENDDSHRPTPTKANSSTNSGLLSVPKVRLRLRHNWTVCR